MLLPIRRVFTAALLLLPAVSAHVRYYIDRRATSCSSQPTTGYAGHRQPRPSGSATFKVTEVSTGNVTSTVCPGAAYIIQVDFGEDVEALLVADSATFLSPWNAARCLNRAATKSPTSTYLNTLLVGCKGSNGVGLSGSVNVGVTWASYSGDYFHAATLTLAVNSTCALPSCTPSPLPPWSSPSPRPPPSPRGFRSPPRASVKRNRDDDDNDDKGRESTESEDESEAERQREIEKERAEARAKRNKSKAKRREEDD